MLVQALAAYADTYLAGAVEDPAFEAKPVRFVVEVHLDGTFARIGQRVMERRKGAKTVVDAIPLLVPKSPVNRNASVYALPGCDAVQYVVGPGGSWTKDSDTEKHERQHRAFVDRVTEVAQATNIPAWTAAAGFLHNAEQLAKAKAALSAERIASGNMTLRVIPPEGGSAGTLVEEEAFKAWWRSKYAEDASGRVDEEHEAMCLVCGTVGPVAETHDKIKGTSGIGGQASGVALMSFDKKAFQSYGWEKNANSPVCPDRANAYVLALNDLLRLGAHRRGATGDSVVSTRYDAGGTAFLFWTAQPTDDDWLTLLASPSDQTIHALFDSVRTGRPVDPGDSTDFFLAALGGNGGRLVVRHWFRDSISAVRARLANWFTDMRIADAMHGGHVVGAFPLWKLLLTTERDGVKTDDLPPGNALALVRRALQGAPLGHVLLGGLLRRLRVADSSARLSTARLGLLRMCVNDLTTRLGSGGATMNESLDDSLDHPAYLCGRLLAVFDGLQYAAQGSVGVTVVDRYYALASTNPLVAFPKVEQLSVHHLKRLRRDRPAAAVAISRKLAELHERIARGEARFPGPLSLEDQGRFAIGFHHQKAEDQARIAEAKARAEQTT